MDAERDMRACAEQSHRVRRGGAWDHQAARARYAVLDRFHHGHVDGVVHAEVVAVDDQHPSVRAKPSSSRQPTHDASVCSIPPAIAAGCRNPPNAGRRRTSKGRRVARQRAAATLEVPCDRGARPRVESHGDSVDPSADIVETFGAATGTLTNSSAKAALTVVISSPSWGVPSVHEGAFWPRHKHAIYSGVSTSPL